MEKNLSEAIDLLSEFIVDDRLSFELFLKKIIKSLEKIINVDSCLIYIYDNKEKKLILIGSKKPHKKILGKIILKKGEGITGWVAENKKPVAIEKKAYLDPRFKFFKELPEDRYEAFLSVPVLHKDEVVGVINLQNKSPYRFKKSEINLITLFTKVIALAFKKFLLIRERDFLKEKLEERKIIEKAKGILMKREGLTEEEAFRKIQTEAMNKRRKLKEIAEAIIMIWG